MPSDHQLQHVSKWDSAHGWVHITPEEIADNCKRSISANEKQFLCECCNQYASFIYSIQNTPHFKHPKGSNDCEEKLSRETFYKENRLGFSLPLKIINPNDLFEKKRLRLAIGFLPLPAVTIKQAEERKAAVSITCDKQKLPYKEFLISQERFSTEHISYQPIGNNIASEYRLLYPNVQDLLHDIWPPIVKGISQEGTLFDGKTGKRLPDTPFVSIGKPYLLLRQRKIDNLSPFINDSLCCKDSYDQPWYIYKIETKELNKASSDFFLRYRATLTDEVSELIPLWPLATISSHVMNCQISQSGTHKLFFYVSGNNILESGKSTLTVQDKSVHGKKLQWFDLPPRDRSFDSKTQQQQILTMSRFSHHLRVLRYIVTQENRASVPPLPALNITVRDSHGISYSSGIYNKLPHKKHLYIDSSDLGYDGFIEIQHIGTPTKRIALFAKHSPNLSVQWGDSIRVFIGMDLAVHLTFQKRAQENNKDTKLLSRLRALVAGASIPIPHTLGGIATKLQDCPMTRQWLLQQIRHGKINVRALNLLIHTHGRTR